MSTCLMKERSTLLDFPTSTMALPHGAGGAWGEQGPLWDKALCMVVGPWRHSTVGGSKLVNYFSATIKFMDPND